jgi:hypothetical protein
MSSRKPKRGGARPGAGRPGKGGRPLYVKLTPEQRAEIDARAAAAGSTVTDYVLARCLAVPQPTQPT